MFLLFSLSFPFICLILSHTDKVARVQMNALKQNSKNENPKEVKSLVTNHLDLYYKQVEYYLKLLYLTKGCLKSFG